jgi:hypothetical protein
LQLAQSLTTNPGRSMRHCVDDPASAVNVYWGVWSVESPVGPPVIVGAGGTVVSYTYVPVAIAPGLPAGSVARTRNVYVPSGSVARLHVFGLAHGAQSLTTVAPRSSRQVGLASAS